ncbi:MAG: choice-of-anchor Q domain-containing protein [Planctomycetota bacterium]
MNGASCDADFDGDMDVDIADLIIWQDNFGVGTTQPEGDADDDGDVDAADLACWEQEFGTGVAVGTVPSGDFDGSGTVDMDDLEMWQEAFEAGTAMGDADGDLDTDLTDFLVWQVDFGRSISNGDWVYSYSMLEEMEPGVILVSTLADESDGDYSLGDLSLREALEIAEGTSGADTIVFASSLWGGTLELGSLGDIDVDTDVTIAGPGADLLTIDANGSDTDLRRVFDVKSGNTVELAGMTVTGGYVEGFGGGILNAGDLTLTRMDIVGNTAADTLGYGGGVFTGSGTLDVVETEIAGNTATYGGGIHTSGALDVDRSTIWGNDAVYVSGTTTGGLAGGINIGGGGTGVDINITGSTISDNDAEDRGGGIRTSNGRDLDIVNSTITENTAENVGGGLIRFSGTATLDNTILAGNTSNTTSDDDRSGVIDSASSNNLFGFTDMFGTGNLWGKAPMLEALADNGGPTLTHALMATSEAIDGGDVTKAALGGATDQRGFNRVFDDPEVSGTTPVDIGAYERGLIVTTAVDEDDTTFDKTSLSLREAVAALSDYTSSVAPNTIEFAPGVVTAGTITLNSLNGQIAFNDDAYLVGPGSSALTVSADDNSRVFQVNTGADVTIDGLTIADGDAGTGNGGAILSTGELTLVDSVVRNSSAANGGGVHQSGGGASRSLTVSGSTIHSNTATQNATSKGGGLFVDGSDLLVTNSTLSGNAASSQGGGAFITHDDSGSFRFVNSTITANTLDAVTDDGAGIAVDTDLDGRVELLNTIVSGNERGPIGSEEADDVFGIFDSASAFNLIGAIDGSTWLADATTISGTRATPEDAGLAGLADNGGPTPTHALLSTSKAIDAGDAATAASFDLVFDQRGELRVNNGNNNLVVKSDIGAFELAADEFFATV